TTLFRSDGLRLVATGIELPLKHGGGITLDNDFPFEIEPGAVTPIFVCIAGITVNTAVLAPLVGIHGIAHAEIWTVVNADDFLWVFFDELRIRVLEEFLVQSLDMLGNVPLGSEFIVRIDLRTPSLKILGVLNRIHRTNILNKLAHHRLGFFHGLREPLDLYCARSLNLFRFDD